jgi:hypothetical protein
MTLDSRTRSVGEVAAQTGLTVRTLHHYDELGLLVPDQRTHAGHRRYGGDQGVKRSLHAMWSNEDPVELSRGMVDCELADYMRRVMRAG